MEVIKKTIEVIEKPVIHTVEKAVIVEKEVTKYMDVEVIVEKPVTKI